MLYTSFLLQIIYRIQVECFLVSQWSIVDTPGVGDEGAYAIVQVGGCGGGMACVAHGAYLRAVTHESEWLGGDLVEVSIVVESPLGAEHDDKLTSLAILCREEHDAYGGGVDPRASTGKHIDALVYNGGTPTFIPEGLVIVTVAVGPHDGHLQILWDEHTEDYDGHEGQEYA